MKNDGGEQTNLKIKDLSLFKSRQAADRTPVRRPAGLGELERESLGHSLVCPFEEQVQKSPHRLALVSGPAALTYDALNRRANRLARRLSGQRSAVLLGHDIDMAVAVLGILKAGGAVIPLSPADPEARLATILRDTGAARLITGPDHLAAARRLIEESGGTIEPVNMAEAEPDASAGEGGGDENLDFDIPPDRPAVVLYTGGSLPAAVSTAHHRAMLDRVHRLNALLQVGGDDRLTILFPPDTDDGLTGLLSALLKGVQLHLFDPGRETLPSLIFRLQQEAITAIFTFPGLFRHLANGLAEGETLGAVRRLSLCGGQVVKKDVELFRQRFPAGAVLVNGFGCPGFGVCLFLPIAQESRIDTRLVPVGYPLDGVEVQLLDDEGRRVGGNRPGEIALRSPALGGEPFCLTAEMGEWAADGSLLHLGTKAPRARLMGRQVDLTEVEAALQAVEGVGEAAAMVREDLPERQQIWGYFCAHDTHDAAGLHRLLLDRLPGYLIPFYLVQLKEMPRAADGEIEKRVLPAFEGIRKMRLKSPPAPGQPLPGQAAVWPEILGLATEQRSRSALSAAGAVLNDYEPPRDDVEERLIEILQGLLGVADIGRQDDFFELGGHSLKAIPLVSQIYTEFEVELSLRQVYDHPLVHRLAGLIKRLTPGESSPTVFDDLRETEKKEYYPLSFKQKRLWVLNQKTPDSSAYHLAGRVELAAPLVEGELEGVIRRLVKRHESLRTGFPCLEGEPVQRIGPAAAVPVETVDLSGLPPQEAQQQREEIYIRQAAIPFDLARPPLLRFLLIKLADSSCEMIFCMHHIVSDGWSVEILKREFARLYAACRQGQAVELAPLRLQYRDFAHWQERLIGQQAFGEEGHRFWLEQLQGGLPRLNLPTDLKGGIDDHSGSMYRCVVPEAVQQRVRHLAVSHHTTLFNVLFAAFNILLSYLTDSPEVVCGIVSAGRDHISLHPIVGYFIDVLIYRCRLDREEDFGEFVERLSREVAEIYRYQHYPVELVFEALKMKFPEIQVAFNMLNMQDDSTSQRLPDTGSYHRRGVGDARFDMEIYAMEYQNSLEIYWNYRTARFREAAVEHIAGTFIKLLDRLSAEPGEEA